jgi:NAD(P)-dependent dehydrogenase (short-subunit alcohol dehydrogenase family)
MSMTFSGKVALVTGGAAGIGRATAQAFAAEGLQVVVSDVDVSGGEGTVQLIRDAGGEALFVRCDVTRDAEVQALLAQVIASFGRLDYAFNNAGIEIEKGKLAEGSEAEFDAIMGVNVKGVWLCMKHQLPLLLAQGGGAIVNTASVAGLGAAPKMSIYAASKHADMWRRAAEADPKKAEFVAGMHPVGRIGKVEEIAAAVLYLCSDAAAFTTGHSLAVDGGATAI